jgi:2-isopropylmalate synthase
VSYVLAHAGGYQVPKELAVDLSRAVQEVTDGSGKELVPSEVLEILEREYLEPRGRIALVDYEVRHPSTVRCRIQARVRDGATEVAITGARLAWRVGE